MASQQQPASSVSSRAGGYKRASRRGAPRRFACDHPGCDKIYSRAEHLQRHQLNHNPKEIFRCDVGDCDQEFVRLDLLARHKKRHTSSYTPRNRIPSFDYRTTAPAKPQHRPRPQQPFVHHPTSSAGPHDSAILLTPNANPEPAPAFLHHPLPGATSHAATAWSPAGQRRERGNPMAMQQQVFYAGRPDVGPEPVAAPAPAPAPVPAPAPAPAPAFANVAFPADDQLLPGNFAAWLFDPQTTYPDISLAGIPFLEGGLESAFNNKLHYDYESLNSLSPNEQASRQSEAADAWITEPRRQELLSWFQVFCKKQPRYESLMGSLVHESNGDMTALSLDMLQDCLREFWDNVSPRLPIVHQHTFFVRDCHVFLLLVMLALGAASLCRRDPTGRRSEYGAFADVIIASARWEILTADDATPPVGLWVAQALLLLEFYEKLCSSRRFHERAHIYHPAFLTLLRRGSPLIGRTGSESPPEPDNAGPQRQALAVSLDSRTWWIRWAERESMHRVVYAAFMLDIIHAAMFGHTADMAAHEIRLPLPCDDSLWTAGSPDVVRQLDANFRMYGLKQVSFLDGLKSALHGKDVKTHSFGRMIIVCGLLSVGWHLDHKETHLKWLELRTSPAETQGNWRKTLLRALGRWKENFDMAACDGAAETPGRPAVSSGPIDSASLLFHLAHISLHADIVDCQVYAGARRLLGRKVSSRDYTNAVTRMGAWARQPSTRHAILHAFKLLHGVLVAPSAGGETGGGGRGGGGAAQYSLRGETDPHRPWIMYYAVLAIWAFIQAVGRPAGKGFPLRPSQMGHSTYARMAEYLSAVARLPELDERTAATLHEGLPELLDVMESILDEAGTELLREARERLGVCRDKLLGGSTHG
ncbi:hypothetical protein CDD83_8965 [Cordyceps sp. RAO-2017]|nr:hypothetical protein CDD83_8965 [Cordyceps sp. RAO-2017]